MCLFEKKKKEKKKKERSKVEIGDGVVPALKVAVPRKLLKGFGVPDGIQTRVTAVKEATETRRHGWLPEAVSVRDGNGSWIMKGSRIKSLHFPGSLTIRRGCLM